MKHKLYVYIAYLKYSKPVKYRYNHLLGSRITGFKLYGKNNHFNLFLHMRQNLPLSLSAKQNYQILT